MTDDWNDELTLLLARSLVEQASPDELEVFDLIAEGYREDGVVPEYRGDGAIGFGIDVVTAAIVAIPVAQIVGSVLQEAASSALTAGGVAGYKSLMHRIVRRKATPAESLPSAVVDRARRAALDQAELMGLKPDQAALLANAVAGVLATSQ